MQTVNGRTPAEVRRYDLFKLIVAAVLLLNWLFLCRSCEQQPTVPTATAPVSGAVAPSAPATTAAPAAAAVGWGLGQLRWEAGKLVLTGRVPDEATRKGIVDEAVARLGAANVVDQLSVDVAAPAAGWRGFLAKLLDWGADKGTHELAFDGDTVVIAGEVDSQADKAARLSWARETLGPDAKIVDRITVKALAPAAAAPAPAIATPTSPPAAAAEQAPSQAKLYFATGSHRLPADARAATAALAKWLTGHADAMLVISGYHDRRGQPAANLELAKRRAFAAAELMIAQGVPRDRIDLVKPQVVDGGADLREARRVELSIRP